MALLPFLPIFEKDRPSLSPLIQPLDFLTMYSAATTTTTPTTSNSPLQFNHLTKSADVCQPSDPLSVGGGLTAAGRDGSKKPEFAPLGLNDSSWGDQSRIRDQILRFCYCFLTNMSARRVLNAGPQRPNAPAAPDADIMPAQNPPRRHARPPPPPLTDPTDLPQFPPTNPQESNSVPCRREPQTTAATLMMMGLPSYLSSLTRFSAGVSLQSPPPPSLPPSTAPPPLPPSLLFPPGLKGVRLMKENPLMRSDVYAGKHWRPESMSSRKLHLLEPPTSEPRTRKRNLKRCHDTPSSGGGALTQDRRRQLFRRGGRVHLADGTVQRVECLQLEDFIQSWTARTAAAAAECPETVAVAAAAANVSLCWALVQDIEAGVTARDVRICFRIQEFLMAGAYRPLSNEGVHEGQRVTLTFEHQCSAENPFFVRTCGWSAWKPQLAHLHCGIICRQLALGDTCLVLVTGSPPLHHLLPPRRSTPPEAALAARVTTKPPGLSFSPAEGRGAHDLPADSKFKRKDRSNENSTESFSSTPPKTKRPPGSVPSYFSAASLAKSPFELV